jgi:hypothetical protein
LYSKLLGLLDTGRWRVTGFPERVTRSDDVAAVQIVERSHCTSLISSVTTGHPTAAPTE